MSLLDSDDFSYYSGRSTSSQQPTRLSEELPVSQPPTTAFDAGKSGGGSTNAGGGGGRVRSGELSLDAQKMSSFSLRRKKDDGGRTQTHKKNKSLGKIPQPPDSPKSKSGPSPNVKSKKQYAYLLEDGGSSDEEEDVSSTFVLSKGHQARERRSSFKSTNSGENLLFTSSITTVTADTNISPVKSIPSAGVSTGFPVSFTPPATESMQPPLPPTGPSVNNNFLLGLDNSTPSAEPIPILPPPPPIPPHGSAYNPPVSISQSMPPSNETEADWSISEELHEKCLSQFKELCPSEKMLSGEKARDFFLKSNLPLPELSKIWKLSDIDGDGSLTLEEFIIAMKLVLMRRRNFEIPPSLPSQLKVPPPKQAPTPVPLVPLFNFPPPPQQPNKGRTQTVPLAPESTSNNAPPIPPHLPAFLSSTTRAKTEPTIAISDVQTSTIDQMIIEDKPHPLVSSGGGGDQIEGGVVDLLTASFMSEGDVPLISEKSPLSIDSTSVKEPAVSRLISLSIGGEESSTGDEDDMSNLVTSGEYSNHPVPKPRKKKRATTESNTAGGNAAGTTPLELYRSKTIHGRAGHAPPPKPPLPYKKKSVSPPPSELTDSVQSVTTPPSVDEDLFPIISTMDGKPSLPPKPLQHKQDSNRFSVQESTNDAVDKGHGRSTSWDLTKVLRDERDLRFQEDVPSAEPPKPPPRRKRDEGGGYHTDDDDDWRQNKPATPLQRSASTGSLASTGGPTSLVMKSRTSSVESGAILMAENTVKTGEYQQYQNKDDGLLIPRTGTMGSRRPAPAPPPNKPKKPMYPPSFKKVIVDNPTQRERLLSADQSAVDDSLQFAEVYQKKSKGELQKSIKRLKEENNMYNSLNSELTKKLNELKQERYRLEAQLSQCKSTVTTY